MARTKGSSAQATRTRIFDAAARLFAAHGFAAVSMRDIAAEVGVQVGALYRYTPDKDSLLFDLVAGHLRALMAAWEGCDDPVPLAGFVRNHLNFNLAQPAAAVISSRELHCLQGPHAREVFTLRADYETILGRILLDRGMSPEEAAFTTRSILAMLNWVPVWFRTGGEMTAAQVADRYVALTDRMVPITV
ncbi:MAG: TetR/AcrR family transcriptional regulator [Pseudomonadota bacterium]